MDTEILVIDDNPENLKLLHQLLSVRGYKIRSMPGGRLGIQSAKTRHPDLILLDISMPEMNGYEVCRTLKEDTELKEVPIIFISALGETLDIVKALAAGGVDYITKPFEIEEVEARISTHLKIRELQLERDRYNEQLSELVKERTLELEIANKKLKSLEQLKSDFLTMISHELRTPLNGILGVCEILLSDAGDGDSLKESYDEGRERILRLLEQAPLLAQLETSSEKSRCSGIPVATLWATAIDSLKQQELIQAFETTDFSDEKSSVLSDPELTSHAISTCIQIAHLLSKKESPAISSRSDESTFRIIYKIPGLQLKPVDAQTFFQSESKSRQYTRAEQLGIDPVIACKVVRALGGQLYFNPQNSEELILELKRSTAEVPSISEART